MVDTVLLLSGGVDSIALAYAERPDLAITIDYGQACAKAEIQASTQVCDELEVAHTVLEADCSNLGAGTMSSREQLEVASTPEWWPYRNQLLITLAAMHAVQEGANELLLASVKSDDQHADGRPEFYSKMDNLLSFQEGDLSVSAPAIEQTSEELVEESGVPLSLLGWAHSCHMSNTACGQCRGCKKRHKVINTVY